MGTSLDLGANSISVFTVRPVAMPGPQPIDRFEVEALADLSGGNDMRWAVPAQAIKSKGTCAQIESL